MNNQESRAFLKGDMAFNPQRMMRYIRSRARLATDEDIEDILQSALIMVTQHFDPSHPAANLSLYCLGACNKAIAQNLERYHKVELRKRDPAATESKRQARLKQREREDKGGASGGEALGTSDLKVTKLDSARGFSDEGFTTGQFRTTSLDSLFDEEDGRTAEDIFGWEYSVLGSNTSGQDPAKRAVLNDLIQKILEELPSEIHRTCFVLKYVEGYKREDLISCLKMDAKSIDTVDKRIVRALKAFREKLEKDEMLI